ncbi:MAG TPA: inner membrane-spanning protein YciB, partial [Rhizomicrobium sp.]
VLFFAASKFFGIYVATGVLIVSVLVALAIGYGIEKRVSPSALITAALILVLGGLTLYLHNVVYLQIKLTIFYAFFGLVLLGGLSFNRLFLKYAFAPAFEISEEGWRALSLRFGLFYLALAILNEIVRREYSVQAWVDFKVIGVIGLHFLFMLAQVPLLMKTQIEEKK